MKVPLSWLKEYVNIPVSVAQLSNDLAGIGFEVESVSDLGAAIDKVYVGKILNVTNHPNADKLVVCLVNTGVETLNIVTGAPNVKDGQLVPVAIDGARLPGGKQINTGDMRGIQSEGMLCSAAELGITADLYDGDCENGIMILSSGKVGDDIKTVFGLDDFVLDIAVTANRPDLQSVYGLAREIATLYNKPLAKLRVDYKSVAKGDSTLKNPKLCIECADFCGAYFGNIVRDVKIKKSTDLLRQRLSKAGIRPINSIVDITNYVLLEVGQPMHAFDYDFVSSDIVVRFAKENEKIKALNGTEYTLQETHTVIANKTTPLAIAGVIGGEQSAVSNDTKNIFLESAHFARAGVRMTSRGIGVRTDASSRYEKGVHLGLQEIGLQRAVYLIAKHKLGLIGEETVACGTTKPKTKVVSFESKQINTLLGIKIPEVFLQKVLSKL
ncbi:MAG: phenylalanine--tRNA ligase subunit beta, partial [Firmicutes bacterium]|nr:phenylalanine--tRNA ligase subunit beta [Bacillota bacterium]